ncbi:hypothetical protein [Streptomyces sp. NPDC091278]|uniref:hypothetical protein n=1 Tax=Streptomyces sp. NPDC091278 TaxID=3155301 RepID=UPI00344DE98B
MGRTLPSVFPWVRHLSAEDHGEAALRDTERGDGVAPPPAPSADASTRSGSTR